MGLLDGMLGNAAKIDPAKIQQEFSQILAKGEVVEHAYLLIRDYFVFTDKRLVLMRKATRGCCAKPIQRPTLPRQHGENRRHPSSQF